MPNICCVDHVISLPENPTEEAKHQFARFETLLLENKDDLGKHSGLWRMLNTLHGELTANSRNTRSNITSITKKEDCIEIEEETAWRPCDAAWATVMENFPLLRYSWAAYEPANLLFEKCDPDGYFNDRLWVVRTDACPDDSQYIELGSDEELWEFLDDTFNISTKGMEPQDVAALAAKKAEEAGCFLELYQYRDYNGG